PDRQVRPADTRALETHAKLARTGLGRCTPRQRHAAAAGENRGPHHAVRSLSVVAGRRAATTRGRAGGCERRRERRRNVSAAWVAPSRASRSSKAYSSSERARSSAVWDASTRARGYPPSAAPLLSRISRRLETTSRGAHTRLSETPRVK